MLAPYGRRRQVRSPLHPEQAACATRIDEGLKTFWNVVEHMQHAADRQQPTPQVEETIFRHLLVMGTGCSKGSWTWLGRGMWARR